MSDDVEQRLAAARPTPAAGFRGDLRRMVLAARPGRHRPARLWAMAGACAGAGAALLVVALLLAR